ncbi:hypothetical protein D3C87_1243080 [compost metagenome]
MTSVQWDTILAAVQAFLQSDNQPAQRHNPRAASQEGETRSTGNHAFQSESVSLPH